MMLLMFLFFIGCVVKSDESPYYVVEMPDSTNRYLEVYWNVPTMQCRSKKIPFQNLHRFGIKQNKDDNFRGEEISILYDPGFFPALFRNESSGKLRYRNGGVPQEGDIEKHLKAFKTVLNQSIPDENFSGIGIIDFESWRPIFRQNFGDVLPYKSISIQIEQNKHWWWPQSWVEAEAKQRFEEAARTFMQSTISLAKQMRPHARWGYYGFPYCFNMASNNMREDCSQKVNAENDQIDWLWMESSALYPSVYSPKELSTYQLGQLIRGRLREASRVKRRDSLILPYFWFRYRNGDFLSEDDLHIALKNIDESKATGFIIWGSSNDVNTVEKCHKLLNYVDNILGPAIARYTKNSYKQELQDEKLQLHNATTTVSVSTESIFTTTEEINVSTLDENSEMNDEDFSTTTSKQHESLNSEHRTVVRNVEKSKKMDYNQNSTNSTPDEINSIISFLEEMFEYQSTEVKPKIKNDENGTSTTDNILETNLSGYPTTERYNTENILTNSETTTDIGPKDIILNEMNGDTLYQDKSTESTKFYYTKPTVISTVPNNNESENRNSTSTYISINSTNTTIESLEATSTYSTKDFNNINSIENTSPGNQNRETTVTESNNNLQYTSEPTNKPTVTVESNTTELTETFPHVTTESILDITHNISNEAESSAYFTTDNIKDTTETTKIADTTTTVPEVLYKRVEEQTECENCTEKRKKINIDTATENVVSTSVPSSRESLISSVTATTNQVDAVSD